MSSRLFWSAIVFVSLSTCAHAGFIEICKDANPAGSVNGLFSFTVAGQPGTFQAPVGFCSPAFTLPDGTATITEVQQAGSTLLTVTTFPTTRLISFNTTLGTATVTIVPGDISTQTLVDFFNTPARVPPIPEPGTAWLLGLGITGWAVRGSLIKRGRSHDGP